MADEQELSWSDAIAAMMHWPLNLWYETSGSDPTTRTFRIMVPRPGSTQTLRVALCFRFPDVLANVSGCGRVTIDRANGPSELAIEAVERSFSTADNHSESAGARLVALFQQIDRHLEEVKLAKERDKQQRLFAAIAAVK